MRKAIDSEPVPQHTTRTIKHHNIFNTRSIGGSSPLRPAAPSNSHYPIARELQANIEIRIKTLVLGLSNYDPHNSPLPNIPKVPLSKTKPELKRRQ